MSWTDWSDSIPWIVAAGGWGITHVFSEARERRKEIRTQIDKVHEQIYKLDQDGRAFHCAEKFDSAKAGDLASKIQILERTMARISILNMDNLFPHIIGLRRAITLTNFDKSTFSTQDLSSEILQAISSASQEVEDELEYQYRARYISHFPYFNTSIGRMLKKIFCIK